jgi:hypothetical protein
MKKLTGQFGGQQGGAVAAFAETERIKVSFCLVLRGR